MRVEGRARDLRPRQHILHRDRLVAAFGRQLKQGLVQHAPGAAHADIFTHRCPRFRTKPRRLYEFEQKRDAVR
jgi:hypothetical protein